MTFAIWDPPSPKDMQHSMALFCAHLVIFQTSIPELALDSLAKLLVMIGQFVGLSAVRRRERDPEHLELMGFPKPQERANPLIASLLLTGPFRSRQDDDRMAKASEDLTRTERSIGSDMKSLQR